MSPAAREILEKALELARDERLALVTSLVDSLCSESVSPSPEWIAETSSRIDQLERGEVKAISWNEVEAQLRRTLGQDAGQFEVPEDLDEPLSDGSGA